MLPDITYKVSDIIKDVAATEIMPRWRALASGDISRKADKSLVTVADKLAEEALTRRLAELLDEPTIVGEEAAEQSPQILQALSNYGTIWIIDPIDGTRSYAEGDENFGIMVALKYRGQLTHSWIYRPACNQLIVSEISAGATLNGEVLRLSTTPRPRAEQSVCLSYRFWPEQQRQPLIDASVDFASHCDHLNSNTTFTWLANGRIDVLLDPARRPWDVAPGVVMYEAMGGYAQHLDGARYTAKMPTHSVLYAPTHEQWTDLAQRFINCTMT